MDFFDAIKNRRSIYALSNKQVIPDEQTEKIIKDSLTLPPSAFNSQTSRAILTIGRKHIKVWDIVKECMKKMIGEESFAKSEPKLNGFQAAYGTVLFFEDMDIVESLENQFPLYSENFKPWALQGSGMAQFTAWVALEAKGWGANLQHYNELIEKKIREEFNVPDNWKLISQLVFGKPLQKAGEKEVMDISKRLMIFK